MPHQQPVDAAVTRMMSEAPAEGQLDLSIGEPDQLLPEALANVAIRSLQTRDTGYTAKLGLTSLRSKAAADINGDIGTYVSEQSLVITVGGSEAVAVAITAACRAGDTIVVPDPAWPNYRVLAGELGIRVATYRQGFTTETFLDLDQVEQHLAAGAKLVVVNSPSNPISSVASQRSLDELVQLVTAYDAHILSDEAYESIVFSGGRAPSPVTSPGGSNVTFVARTFSKTYSMTGLRVGFLTYPEQYHARVTAIHGSTVGCAPRTAQIVAEHALDTLPNRGSKLSAIYRKRFELAVSIVGEWMPNTDVSQLGGFYVWLDGSHTGKTGDALAATIGKHGVLCSSGNAYSMGETHAVRIALTANEADLERALLAAREVFTE